MMYSKYTMTLARMSLMLEIKDIRLVCKYRYVPRFVVRHWFIKLMTEFDQMFGGNSGDLKDETVRIMLWNRIKNILPMVSTLLATDDSELAGELYEHYFGKKYEAIEDLELIRNEVKRLSNRYKIMFRKKKTDETPESVTFESIILGVETVLDKPQFDREKIKLYQFKEYYDLAIDQIAQRKKK